MSMRVFLSLFFFLFLSASLISQSYSQDLSFCDYVGEKVGVEEEDRQKTAFKDGVYYEKARQLVDEIKEYGATSEKVEQFKNTLREIVRSNTKFYDYNKKEAISSVILADEDEKNNNNMVLFYTGQSIEKTSLKHGGIWDFEHVWAKSYGFKDDKLDPHKDLHNLRPCNPSLNRNTKNDKYFKEGGDEVCIYSGQENSCVVKANYSEELNTFEPPSTYKGDTARIVFYMELMYGSDPLFNLRLSDDENEIKKKAAFGYKSDLLKWATLYDAVDERERFRNKVLYCVQRNRNPFIDHPEWISIIYGDINTVPTLPPSPTLIEEEIRMPGEIPPVEPMSPVGVAIIVTIFSIATLFIAGVAYNTYKGAKGLDRLPLYSFFSNLSAKKPVKLDEENAMDGQ